MSDCRQYLITYCVYADDDVAPTCLYAGIQVPPDVEEPDVADHVRQLMQQIVNELPMHMRKQYGRTPATGDQFWMCEADPHCEEVGDVVRWRS